MPAIVVSSPARPANFRRICCWCHSDLGPLEHPIGHDSYAICQPCQRRYFGHLYEADAVEQRTTVVARERAVGA
jgi:hypothetical protein